VFVKLAMPLRHHATASRLERLCLPFSVTMHRHLSNMMCSIAICVMSPAAYNDDRIDTDNAIPKEF
jgi:hypothetical protein